MSRMSGRRRPVAEAREMLRKALVRDVVPSLVAAVLMALGAGAAWAQAPSPEPEHDLKTRQLWDDAFTSARPSTARTTSKTARARRPASSESFVGVTVWHLEPASGSTARDLVLETAPEEIWTLQRVEIGAGVPEGQRIRLSVEASRKGYLYVVDREQYADGSFGEPFLIFPTLRTRGGNNEVRAGRVIEVPALDDRPPYFTMKRSRADHQGEVLTVLVSAQPIPGLQIGRRALPLSAAQVAEWEKKWAAPTKRLEQAGGAGRPYSKAERAAGEDQTRLLTQEDPLPQSLYRIEAKPEGLLIAVPLKISN